MFCDFGKPSDEDFLNDICDTKTHFYDPARTRFGLMTDPLGYVHRNDVIHAKKKSGQIDVFMRATRPNMRATRPNGRKL